jgi:hypothetical protein
VFATFPGVSESLGITSCILIEPIVGSSTSRIFSSVLVVSVLEEVLDVEDGAHRDLMAG